MPDVSTFLLVALAGGVLGLDATAAVQAMISQPIVVGPIVGALLGRPEAGLAVGAAMQLLFAADLPLGASIPPDGCTSTAAITAGVAWTQSEYSVLGDVAYAATAAVLLGWPLAHAAGRADFWVRHWNARWGKTLDRALDSSDPAGVDRAMWGGVGSYLAKGFVATAVLAATATALMHLLGEFRSRTPWASVPDWIFLLLPAGALGLLVRSYSDRMFSEEWAAGVAAVSAAAVAFLVPSVSPLVAVSVGAGAGIGAWAWRSR